MPDNLEQALGAVPEGGVVEEPTFGMSQEEMKKNLQSMMGAVEGKMQNLNSIKFASDNKRTSERSEALQILFDRLMELGVNPSDVKQVGEFLDKLKTKNPVLYEAFERIFEEVLPQESEQPMMEGMMQ